MKSLSGNPQEWKIPFNNNNKSILCRAKRSEREFFTNHKEPYVHSQRCDACRLIAGKFHFAFELGESKLGIQTHNFEEYEELGM